MEKYKELIKELKEAGLKNCTDEQYAYLCELLIMMRSWNK